MKTNRFIQSFILKNSARAAVLLAAAGFTAAAIAADAPSKDAPILPTQAGTPAASASSLPTGVSISGAAGDASITDPNIIARIGNTEVTTDEVRAAIASLTPQEQAEIAGDQVMLNKAVRLILMQRVVMKELLSKQFDKQPDVSAHIERVRETTLTDMYLESVSKPPADYPSDAELHAAYDAHKTAFTVPHQFLLAQIFVGVAINAEKETSDKAQNKVDAILTELKQPDADFAAIAKKESEDKKSADNNGEMGWIKDDKMPARIRAQAYVLKKGAISVPVRLMDGWHILKMIDYKDVSVAPFSEVKDQLAETMRAQRQVENRLLFLNKLLGDNPLTINDQAVSLVLKKPAK